MTSSVCTHCASPLSGTPPHQLCPRCTGRLLLDTSRDTDATCEGGSLIGGNVLRVGEYELGAELGRGAMGVVYRARQPRLRREVAVKVILASRFAGASARKRFLAEAELAAQLDHPHIVPIYEVGETPDGPFYAMKLVEGGTLAQRMTDDECRAATMAAAARPAGLRQAALVISQAARAVHHAHQRGVLHRDLKPGNILIDAEGEPHITDFGLARQIGAESSLTLSGSTLGTPAYMAPEQAAGERGITTAADVWSLGAILFHLLAGHPPFTGLSAADILLQVRTQEPRLLRTLNPAAPRDLETICLKCLEKKPAERYASALALSEDLERWMRNEPIRARPSTFIERAVKWTRRHPARAGVTVAFILVVTGGLAGVTSQWRRAQSHAQESRQRLVRMATATAIHHIESRDLLGALPWFIEAMQLDSKSARSQKEDVYSEHSALRTGHSAGDQSSRGLTQGENEPSNWHRIRFATTLRQAPRLAQMWFHDGPVNYAEFSSDGSRVASASADGTARVWDVASGAALTPPLRHSDSVTRAVFSPDGERIATAGDDGMIRIWSARTGEPLAAPLSHGGKSLRVAFSPDGKRIATAGSGSSIKLWDSRTGEQLERSLMHESEMVHVSFSPDGRRILTGSYSDNAARLWDADSGSTIGRPMSHSAPLRSAMFSPGGERVVTVGYDNRARIWSATNTAALALPLHHNAGLWYAEFSPDGNRVVTAALDATARVWNAFTGEPVTPPLQHSEALHHAAFSPDGRWVVTASEDHTAQIWDALRGTPLFPPLWHGHAVERSVFSPDGRHLLTASLDGLVRLWDLTAGGADTLVLEDTLKTRKIWMDSSQNRIITSDKENNLRVWDATTGLGVSPPLPHNSATESAALSPDGTRLARIGGSMRIWDVASGRQVSQFHRGGPQIVWRADGRAVLVAHADGTADIIDPDTGIPVTPALQHRDRAAPAAFSADGGRVATSIDDRTAGVWDGLTGLPISPPLRHTGYLTQFCLSPDGRRIVTTSTDGMGRLWNSDTGELIAPPLRHGGWVNDVVFSPDGKRVMTASDDGTARVWDAISGKPLTPPLRIGGGVHRPRFSRDGRLVLASNGFVVGVWEAQSGTPVTPPLTSHVPLPEVSFSADARTVIAATHDGRVLSWDISPVDWPQEDLASAARLLSCREIDPTGAPVPLEQLMEGLQRTAVPVSAGKAASTHGAGAALGFSEMGPGSARDLLRGDWQRLKARLDVRSRRGEEATANDALKWHTLQAGVAESSQQWFAALFHLGRLCGIRPNDAALQARLSQAQTRQLKAGVLSAALRVPPRPTVAASPLIDLTPYYTFTLTDTMHETGADNSFSALPAGITNLGGVDFDVRGVVHLAGRESTYHLLPDSVQGIRVGLKATRLHFLHACSLGVEEAHIASFVVHYADGLSAEIPIVFGRDVRDWHSHADEPESGANARIAWRGTNAWSRQAQHYIRLFKTTWTNALPGMEILGLDYVSKLTESAPFLIAITAEE